jgi:PAS domain S-box-containing protein
MPNERRHILLVEDSASDARMFRAVFASHPDSSWTIAHVERLQEALKYVATHEVALVLLDLSLPDSVGFNTLEAVLQQAPHVPIVVLTSLDDEEFALKAVQEGAQDYLVKGQLASGTLFRTLRYAIERHRLRQDLGASEERYRDLFENASDAILSFTSEGIITAVNRGLETMLGWSREDLVGQSLDRLLPPNELGIVKARALRMLCEEGPPAGPPMIEVEAIRASGDTVPVEIRDSVLYDARGKPTDILAMARDISLRKELEHKRTEFIAMLSHDIKNPLAVLIGYADYLQDEADTNGAIKSMELLPWIKSSGLTILALVNNYLDLSRIEDQRLILGHEAVSLTDVLGRIGLQYGGEAQHRHIRLELEFPTALLMVDGDPVALERVFSNLVYNALKFTPSGGKVTVSGEIRGDDIRVTISDTGPGITPEDMLTLFDKYQRTTGLRRKGGMGLGLFIVKTLVERQHGRVEVESTVGQGTQFRVIFPARANNEERQKKGATGKDKEAKREKEGGQP